jgi:hypothetical protein
MAAQFIMEAFRVAFLQSITINGTIIAAKFDSFVNSVVAAELNTFLATFFDAF